MSNIKEIWPSFDVAELGIENNIPFKILEVQVEAINKQKEISEISATIVTKTFGEEATEIMHTLYLVPIYGNGYNYRYIEFTQPIDEYYPVHISAFQSGNTDFGVVDEEKDVYAVLTKIFSDPRTKIVFDQLKSIGRTVKSWKEGL